MKSNKNEFLKLLTAYQGIIHKVNRIYFRSEADREDNFQETVYQLFVDLYGGNQHLHLESKKGQPHRIS